MKSHHNSALIICSVLVSSLTLTAQHGRDGKGGNQPDLGPLQAELQLIDAARGAATRDDAQAVDDHLAVMPDARLKLAPSVARARRAVELCAVLRSANEYERAYTVAERTVRHLSKIREGNSAERVERLYWEAWLVGEVLDEKRRAIELLTEAARFAPDDERVLSAQARLLAAVASFGR